MSQEIISSILNQFLFLEEGQVVFYSTLAEKATHEELNRGLKRLAAIEANHVKNLKEKIVFYFPEDNPLNPVRTTAVGVGLNLFGSSVGIAKGIVGLKNLIKAGALAETKAISEYRQALTKIQDPELRDMLWDHLIDEELHLLWLNEQAKQI